MKLLTQAQRELLLANGRAQREAIRNGMDDITPLDPKPIVKLFTPDGGATWLLTELDPDYPTLAFGLCDLGMGFPELGYVSLSNRGALRAAGWAIWPLCVAHSSNAHTTVAYISRLCFPAAGLRTPWARPRT